MLRRVLWLVCLSLTASSIGCFKFLDEIRRDDGRMSKLGASAKSRQIEDNLDWGTGF